MSFRGVVFLNDGNEMPTIAFGTGSTMKYKDVTVYVQQAIEAGICHIDTAARYGTECSVGIAIEESGLKRSDLFVTSKYGGGDIQLAVRESLSELGLDYLDLYLVHFPGLLTDYEANWREFEMIKEQGLAMSIGVSNFDLEKLQRIMNIARIKPAVNQIELHPYNYASHKTLLKYAASHGVAIAAYGSLCSLTTFAGGPVDAPIHAAARRLHVTPTQVIFSWVRSKGVTIVTTSRSKERLQEYLAVEDLPRLSREEIAAIDSAGAKGAPCPAPPKLWW
ncbi:Aldo/keto reductase [Leucogyrophana mollusca]|uniref:Aldo/keto reductase n=1 Tax=Leucogyrophana mollusca TaxID=85980 RepID=A0ACB8BJ84_9AGAM|nr:Aldo/keto reductase [Leucogyrophana mollusca]